jgi:hypothetical protein
MNNAQKERALCTRELEAAAIKPTASIVTAMARLRAAARAEVEEKYMRLIAAAVARQDKSLRGSAAAFADMDLSAALEELDK